MTKNKALALVLAGLIPIYALLFLNEQKKLKDLRTEVGPGRLEGSRCGAQGWPFVYTVLHDCKVMDKPPIYFHHREPVSNRYILNIVIGLCFVGAITFGAWRLVVFVYDGRRLNLGFLVAISCTMAGALILDGQLEYVAKVLSNEMTLGQQVEKSAIVANTYQSVAFIRWFGLYCVAYLVVVIVASVTKILANRRRGSCFIDA